MGNKHVKGKAYCKTVLEPLHETVPVKPLRFRFDECLKAKNDFDMLEAKTKLTSLQETESKAENKIELLSGFDIDLCHSIDMKGEEDVIDVKYIPKKATEDGREYILKVYSVKRKDFIDSVSRVRKLHELFPGHITREVNKRPNISSEYYEVLYERTGETLENYLEAAQEPIPVCVLTKILKQCADIMVGIEEGFCGQKTEMIHHGRFCPNNIWYDGTSVRLGNFTGTQTVQLTKEQFSSKDDVHKSIFYRAPEILLCGGDDSNYEGHIDLQKCDIFALGMTFMRLFLEGREKLCVPEFVGNWKMRHIESHHAKAMAKLRSILASCNYLSSTEEEFAEILMSMMLFDSAKRMEYRTIQYLLSSTDSLDIAGKKSVIFSSLSSTQASK